MIHFMNKCSGAVLMVVSSSQTESCALQTRCKAGSLVADYNVTLTRPWSQ